MTSKINVKIIQIATFFSIFSQLPIIRITLGIDTQMITYFCWGIVILFTFLNFRESKIFKTIMIPLLFMFTFLIGIIFLEIIFKKDYFSSVFIMPIIISCLMLFIGYFNAKNFSEYEFKKIAKVYIIATILLCIDVYIEYLHGTSLKNIQYVFKAKNSVGQILLTSTILVMYCCDIKKIIKIIIFIIFFYVTVLMRSRGSIISFFLIPILYLTSKETKKRNKFLIIIFFLFLVGVILLNDNIYNFFIKNILFNLKDNKDISFNEMNTITSGRFNEFEYFKNLFKENKFTGIGNYYMDNMILASLLNFGLCVGIIVILFALMPLKVCFKSKINNYGIKMAVRTISVVYVFNGLFECLAPFGPGVKCFFLWFILGILLNKSNKITNQDISRGEYEK